MKMDCPGARGDALGGRERLLVRRGGNSRMLCARAAAVDRRLDQASHGTMISERAGLGARSPRPALLRPPHALAAVDAVKRLSAREVFGSRAAPPAGPVGSRGAG